MDRGNLADLNAFAHRQLDEDSCDARPDHTFRLNRTTAAPAVWKLGENGIVPDFVKTTSGEKDLPTPTSH
jgi:hypothetical protein